MRLWSTNRKENTMKKRVRKYILLVATIMALWACWLGNNVQAQTLFPAPLESFPQDGATNPVLCEQGRKGLLFKFKFFNADGITENDAAGFPLNMAMATVTLTIGANPHTCTATANPTPGECGYQVVAGTDDPALDTVKTFYNGDFDASTQVQYSGTGERSAGMVLQSGDPHTVTFTTGNANPRDPASIELVFDISGSMGLPAVPNGTVSRMDALKSASQAFFH